MSKAIIFGAVAAAAIVGAGAYFYVQPAQVVGQAVLTDGGKDVTDLARWSAGVILDVTEGDGGTLTDVMSIMSNPNQANAFNVPPGEEVYVRAFLPNLEPEEQFITVGRGETQTVEFVLDAALLTVNVQSDSNDPMNLWLSDGFASNNLGPVEDGEKSVLLPSGEHFIEVTDDNGLTLRRPLTVSVGDEVAMDFDMRQRDVALGVAGDLAWQDSFATPVFELRPQDGRDGFWVMAGEDGIAQANGLFPGDYDVALRFESAGGRMSKLTATDTITVTAASDRIDVPLAFRQADITLAGYEAEDLNTLEIYVVEALSKGEPYALGLTEGSDAISLPFAPMEQDRADIPFAVTVWGPSGINGMAEVPAGDLGTIADVTVTKGAGFDLCMQIYFPSDCEDLTP
ncbi:hypothetical protein [Yoonia sp. 208BN28-4]|uniref:hypothetical protein n=1 Tax=Yoonia sp. 208BN28-4 TaxID=3126505 RepID=UPI00309E5D83